MKLLPAGSTVEDPQEVVRVRYTAEIMLALHYADRAWKIRLFLPITYVSQTDRASTVGKLIKTPRNRVSLKSTHVRARSGRFSAGRRKPLS